MPVNFEDYDAILLDLDGTLVRQDTPMPGAAELLAYLREAQPRFAVITNSTMGPHRLSLRLKASGLGVPAQRIWSAAQAACDYVVAKVKGTHKRPPRVFNLGTADIDEMLAGRAEMVDGVGPCDAVIAGTPTNLRAGNERQRIALELLRNGAELVGVCADRIYPSQRGLEFGCGAFCSMLSYAAGVRATYCGKPERRFFLELCRRLKVAPQRCLLIGDNLEADILGGKAMGMRTMLVLGGVTRAGEVERLAAPMRPDAVANSLLALLE